MPFGLVSNYLRMRADSAVSVEIIMPRTRLVEFRPRCNIRLQVGRLASKDAHGLYTVRF